MKLTAWNLYQDNFVVFEIKVFIYFTSCIWIVVVEVLTKFNEEFVVMNYLQFPLKMVGIIKEWNDFAEGDHAVFLGHYAALSNLLLTRGNTVQSQLQVKRRRQNGALCCHRSCCCRTAVKFPVFLSFSNSATPARPVGNSSAARAQFHQPWICGFFFAARLALHLGSPIHLHRSLFDSTSGVVSAKSTPRIGKPSVQHQRRPVSRVLMFFSQLIWLIMVSRRLVAAANRLRTLATDSSNPRERLLKCTSSCLIQLDVSEINVHLVNVVESFA